MAENKYLSMSFNLDSKLAQLDMTVHNNYFGKSVSLVTNKKFLLAWFKLHIANLFRSKFLCFISLFMFKLLISLLIAGLMGQIQQRFSHSDEISKPKQLHLSPRKHAERGNSSIVAHSHRLEL